MSDRGMIKWAPFDSVTSSKALVRRIANEKEKIQMPQLSEEQLDNIEENLKNAYYRNDEVVIKYYSNGKIFSKKCWIAEVDLNNKKILLSDNSKVYFGQIVNISY